MNSIILKLAAKYLKPLFLIFSVYVLLRGHNAPGGGFIGGLLAASGILFYAFAYGPEKISLFRYFKPKAFLILGMVLVLISATWSFAGSKPIFTGLWTEIDIGIIKIKAGTPLLFDTGIYLIVVGALSKITLTIIEELEWK